MANNRNSRGHANNALNVCQCMARIIQYLNAIRIALSADQLVAAYQMIQQTKTELIERVNSVPLQELRKFQKFKKQEEVANNLASKRNDIHRDLFKSRMHYVLNGVQQTVEQRKYYFMTHRDEIVVDQRSAETSKAAETEAVREVLGTPVIDKWQPDLIPLMSLSRRLKTLL